MSSQPLTETVCARLLVVVLASEFGFDVESHRCSAQRDEMRRKMLISAEVAGRTFSGELSFDDLSQYIDHARAILTEQLQSQVFALWQQSSQPIERRYA